MFMLKILFFKGPYTNNLSHQSADISSADCGISSDPVGAFQLTVKLCHKGYQMKI